MKKWVHLRVKIKDTLCLMIQRESDEKIKIILVILLHAHNIIIMQISERIICNLASHPRPCVNFISLILSSTDKDSFVPILKHVFLFNPLPLF